MKNREGGNKEIKIKIGDNVADQLFSINYWKDNLDQLSDLINHYDWFGFKPSDTLRSKIEYVRGRMVALKNEVIAGKIKNVEVKKVTEIIDQLNTTFLVRKMDDVVQIPEELYSAEDPKILFPDTKFMN